MSHGCRSAKGEPELTKLKTGVSEHVKTTETKNLGELFKEAQKRNLKSNQRK